MKNTLRVLLLLPMLLSAGCCANDTCNCDDLFADALYFLFKTSGPNAFAAADIDTVYLLRYASPIALRPSDSIAIPRTRRKYQNSGILARITRFGLDSSTIVLSNSLPFTATSGTNLGQYTYLLRVRLGNSRRNPTYTYNINSIQITGRYNSDGCCTCYENQTKSAFIRNKYQNFTESAGRPVVDTLAKY